MSVKKMQAALAKSEVAHTAKIVDQERDEIKRNRLVYGRMTTNARFSMISLRASYQRRRGR